MLAVHMNLVTYGPLPHLVLGLEDGLLDHLVAFADGNAGELLSCWLTCLFVRLAICPIDGPDGLPGICGREVLLIPPFSSGSFLGLSRTVIRCSALPTQWEDAGGLSSIPL